MKSNFPVVRLGRHVRQVSHRNKGGVDADVFSVTNSEGFTSSTSYFSKEVFSKDVSNYKIVKKGQFSYNPSRINVGSIDYLRSAEIVLVSPLYVVFETDSELNADFLLRYMKSNWGNLQIRANTEGTVRDSLKYKGLENIKIPLPHLNDQKRIAHLLSMVKGLVIRRKQHLQQLDDLLKSIFWEMFGDPVRNEKGWNTTELVWLSGGVIDCPHSTPTYSDKGTGYFCVRSGDLVDGYLNLSKAFHVEQDVYEERIKRYAPQAGDIVYSREGGRLGNAARILGGESISLGQRIMLFKANDEDSSNFMWALLESRPFKAKLQGLVGGGGAPRVNIKDLKSIVVIQPPDDMKAQFSQITKQIDQIKNSYQQGLADLEDLYGVLTQKAFKGELDLSRVPLPDESPSESAEIIEGLDLALPKERVEGKFKLPEPAEDWMSSAESRNAQYGVWLDAYIDDLASGTRLLLDTFWDLVLDQLYDFIGEDAPGIHVDEYDQVKGWLFKAIESGRVEQVRDSIKMDGKLELGNQVVLEKV
ncbi:MAG: restriction endonuclease subunit S [Halodesulfovibrio sp.]|uniref:restriction endonuclease subunit S n=1 Tax=Halodesulfovibrio sp. TaxID=1912772 RepID=UPI00359CDAE6